MTSRPADNLQTLRILVVEDQILLADLAQDMLMDAGASDVLIASGVKDALAALTNGQSIHAAVIDLNLGDHFGDSLADTLLSQKVPFIFVTGYGRDALLGEHLKHVPLLPKPYTAEMLIEALSSAIAGSRA